ncbi:hypothetical protein CSC62_14020 [Pseudoxanthomonas jiangsuensis]|nr:hypothetical protein CSC62_14020 [Pseudoxanthomonas jiangsuensis]
MAARGGPSVPTRDLVRLRDDYERMARQASEAARTADAARRPGLRAQARERSAIASDLNDLIEGRDHPSARRS